MKFADVDEQCANYKHLKKEDIFKLEEWQRKQPHLPAPLHPIETALFLHRSRFSIEAAKQRIDKYYTYRTQCPELFSNRDPFDPQIQQAMDTNLITVLPELTHEGYLVMYTRLLIRNAEDCNWTIEIKVIDMIISLTQKQRGCHSGFTLVMDLEGVTISYIFKINLKSLKMMLLFMQKMMLTRVKSIHLVNGLTFTDKLLALAQPFLKKDFPVYVHYGDNATIFKYVAKDILPIECGGSRFCATDYYKNVTRKEIESNADYFKMEDRQVVNESQRDNQYSHIDDFLGIQGTFKQLNVD